MTALAEALLAAQRQAIGALEKAFIAEKFTADEVIINLGLIGCTDVVEQEQLLAALRICKAFGVTAQTNGAAPRPAALDEPATKAQLDFLAKLADDKGRVVSTDGMTKAQASQAIEALKADREVPF